MKWITTSRQAMRPALTAPSAVADERVLAAVNLTAGYGETVVIRDVNMEIAPSSVVALLGPNGAGKTTLLRAVSGLIRPMSGEVILRGEDVVGVPAEQIARRGICHIPEGRGIFPSLTVKDNVILQSTKSAEREAIERVGTMFPELGRRMGQVAGSLSGGEQQMLALARASLSDPSLVVVDEASLGLAPLLVDRVFDTFARIAATGAALLIVEQYVPRALAIADTVYLMDHGSIAFSGPASAVDSHELAQRYLGVSSDDA
jgi:branched-chain amino acid transport system ATP-binding protein